MTENFDPIQELKNYILAEECKIKDRGQKIMSLWAPLWIASFVLVFIAPITAALSLWVGIGAARALHGLPGKIRINRARFADKLLSKMIKASEETPRIEKDAKAYEDIRIAAKNELLAQATGRKPGDILQFQRLMMIVALAGRGLGLVNNQSKEVERVAAYVTALVKDVCGQAQPFERGIYYRNPRSVAQIVDISFAALEDLKAREQAVNRDLHRVLQGEYTEEMPVSRRELSSLLYSLGFDVSSVTEKGLWPKKLDAPACNEIPQAKAISQVFALRQETQAR